MRAGIDVSQGRCSLWRPRREGQSDDEGLKTTSATHSRISTTLSPSTSVAAVAGVASSDGCCATLLLWTKYKRQGLSDTGKICLAEEALEWEAMTQAMCGNSNPTFLEFRVGRCLGNVHHDDESLLRRQGQRRRKVSRQRSDVLEATDRCFRAEKNSTSTIQGHVVENGTSTCCQSSCLRVLQTHFKNRYL